MIDIETAGTKQNAAILSVACIRFIYSSCQIRDVFYQRVDPTIYDNYTTSFSMDVSTIQWWMKQEEEVRDEAWNGTQALYSVLQNLIDFMKDENDDLRVWSHGKEFDLPILESAFRVFNLKAPWNYYQTMDTRTVYDLTGVQPEETKEYPKHHALGDCYSQIYALKKNVK